MYPHFGKRSILRVKWHLRFYLALSICSENMNTRMLIHHKSWNKWYTPMLCEIIAKQLGVVASFRLCYVNAPRAEFCIVM
jgi:hypothetical protein